MTIATRRIALIGFGAIGEAVAAAMQQDEREAALVAILARSPASAARAAAAPACRHADVVDDLDALLRLTPDLVIEAAGHAAVAAYGETVLARGHDLLVSSVGALADHGLARALVAAARGGGELWAACGAVAGLDGLLAARTAGLSTLSYTSIKAPSAWMGTAAERLVDLGTLRSRTVFFEGTAREAATAFPQNANVGATIALAGLGLDRTRVALAADPEVAGPLGIIDATGDFGRFHFEILGLASPSNPKTSLITGHSLAAAATSGMCFRLLPMMRQE